MSGGDMGEPKRDPGFGIILRELGDLCEAAANNAKAVIELRARVIGVPPTPEAIAKDSAQFVVGGVARDMYEMIRSVRRSLRDSTGDVDAMLREFPVPTPAAPTERIR